MQKIKITDCITQDQPELERVVLDDKGVEIARLRHLNIREKTIANQYAVNLSKRAELQKMRAEELKEIPQEKMLKIASEMFNGADYLLKSLEYAIIEWCFEDDPTVENMLLLTTSPKANKIFNLIANSYDTMVKEFEASEKAIAKN
jgi:hypothetical protein